MARSKLALVGLGLVAAAACGVNGGPKHACRIDGDCNAPRVCSASFQCVDRQSLPGWAGAAGTSGLGGDSAGTSGAVQAGMSGASVVEPDAGDGGSSPSNAGSGGAAGEAGAASTGPVNDGCSANADCNDGDPCNGVERCINRTCVSSAPPCVTSDSHCTATCSNQLGVPLCGVVARDADHDGHGAAACAEAPGDDCDDNAASVFPGATEVCDGVDNDCNGKSDLEEGLPLSGETRPWAVGYGGQLAVGEDKDIYGVAWLDIDHKTSYFHGANAQGTKAFGNPVPLNVPLATDPNTAFAPSLYWGKGGWGVKFGLADGNVYFRMVTEDASLIPMDPFRLINPGPLLSPAAGVWLNFWPCCTGRSERMQRIANGTTNPVSSVIGNSSFGAAASHGNFATFRVYRFSGEGPDVKNTAFLTRMAPDLSVLGPDIDVESVSPPGALSETLIAGGETGYALTWSSLSDTGTLTRRYAEYSPDGVLSCGPISLAFSSLDGDPPFAPTSMIAAGADHLMIGSGQKTGGNWVVQAARVRAGCGRAERFDIDTSADSIQGPNIAHSANGYAAMWQTTPSTLAATWPTVWIRTFGNGFCR